ncbi:hypothetical protein AB1Y20_002543 [Prymnesium parvum]|uniref:Uncharacterized protein n=1 Tax=Prymnesium parvum TaxID=97485 RepID=A0AB34J9K5_PRYPA
MGDASDGSADDGLAEADDYAEALHAAPINATVSVAAAYDGPVSNNFVLNTATGVQGLQATAAPPHTEMQLLHNALCREDIGWQLHPDSTYGQKQASGQPKKGGEFLMYVRRELRKKFDTARGRSGDGGMTASQLTAMKWLRERELEGLVTRAFEGGGKQVARTMNSFGLPASDTWGRKPLPTSAHPLLGIAPASGQQSMCAQQPASSATDAGACLPEVEATCGTPAAEHDEPTPTPSGISTGTRGSTSSASGNMSAGQLLLKQMVEFMPNMQAILLDNIASRQAAVVRQQETSAMMAALLQHIVRPSTDPEPAPAPAQQ